MDVTLRQGWRLEIKAYPRLTEFGSWRGRDKSNMYGGFYTQAEVGGGCTRVIVFSLATHKS